MKRLIILIALIPLVASLEPSVCDRAFYYLIEGNTNISEFNLINNINNSESYLLNYSTECYPINDKKLPFVDIIKTQPKKNITLCDLDINKRIIWKSYDLDKSIGKSLPNLYLGNVSCESIEYWKWIIDTEQNGDNFIIKGIRLYWIISLFIGIPIIAILWYSLQVNKKINKELNYR